MLVSAVSMLAMMATSVRAETNPVSRRFTHDQSLGLLTLIFSERSSLLRSVACCTPKFLFEILIPFGFVIWVTCARGIQRSPPSSNKTLAVAQVAMS
jgi:hypothetical protein